MPSNISTSHSLPTNQLESSDIRKQQVANINKLNCGLRAAAIGEDDETDKEIEEGDVNIVFGSAEQWLSDRWKKCLQFGSLHGTEVLVIDEVHTVETWYCAFRPFVITFIVDLLC